MANKYPANLGDVLKHLILCETFAEMPERYLESHAGAPRYPLATVKPGPGGIWDFREMCSRVEPMRESQYAQLLGDLPGSPDKPGTYLGSVSLALGGLPSTVPLRVADIDSHTANRLRAELPPERCSVLEQDGLSMVRDESRVGDLVLIDPFKMSADNAGEAPLSPAEAFVRAAAAGARVLLWYPIHMPHQNLTWMPRGWPSGVSLPSRYEVRRTNTQAGLAGCGVLMTGMSRTTEERVMEITSSFGSALTARWPKHRFFHVPSDGSGGNPLSPDSQGTA